MLVHRDERDILRQNQVGRIDFQPLFDFDDGDHADRAARVKGESPGERIKSLPIFFRVLAFVADEFLEPATAVAVKRFPADVIAFALIRKTDFLMMTSSISLLLIFLIFIVLFLFL